MVACWSWSAGFLLGCLRNAVQSTMRGSFLLLLALFQVVNLPQRWFNFWMVLSGVRPMPSVDPTAPVALDFYLVIFPFIFLGVLVALPSMWGMRQQPASVSDKFRSLLVIGACVSVVTMLLSVPWLGFLFGASGRQWVCQHQDAMRLSSLVAYWPMLYMAAVGLRRFHRRRAALA